MPTRVILQFTTSIFLNLSSHFNLTAMYTSTYYITLINFAHLSSYSYSLTDDIHTDPYNNITVTTW